MQFDELDGTSEKISGQISVVLFHNISSNKLVSYQGSALTDASITEFGEQLLGIVSRHVSINCKFFGTVHIFVNKCSYST